MRKILLIIIFSSIFIPYANASADLSDRITLVSKLGIIDALGEDFMPDEAVITRGEMAFVVSKILNLDGVSFSSTPFLDVPEGHKYYSSIRTVQELNIMVGEADNYFRPDSPLTYQQAVKIFVYILGYSVKAEYNGGYPAGYLSQANSLRILDGINLTANEHMKRSDTAYLIYNCLDVRLIKEVSFGSYVEYSSDGDETILSKYFNVSKNKGIINGVNGIAVTNDYKLTSRNEVVISGVGYLYDDFDMFEYAGYEVEYYVRTDDTERLIYAFPTTDNSELVISIHDLETGNNVFSLTNFMYRMKNDRVVSAKIVDKNCFVVNGAYYLDFDISDLNFNSGYVKLIDNNSDGIYDIVFIWDFENYVVTETSGDSVLCKYNMSIKEDDEAEYRVQGANGIWGGWEQLLDAGGYNVISLATSRDNKLITAYISTGGVSGTIEEVNPENGRTWLKIDGNSYVLSSAYESKKHYSDYIEIELGLESEFYFDVTGEIAAVFQNAALSNIYGYLIGLEKPQSLGATYRAQIYDQNGKLSIYSFSDKVKFTSVSSNGKTVKPDIILDAFKEGTAEYIDQLVMFDTNESGEIIAISKATNPSVLTYDIGSFSKDYSLGATEFRFQDATSAFGDATNFSTLFRISDSTKIFCISTQGGEILVDKLSMGNVQLFMGGSRYKNIDFYDCDETNNASAIVYKTNFDSDASLKNEFFFVVTGVYQGVNEDGERKDMVRGYQQGAERSYIYETPDGIVPTVGSIVFCERKLSGELIISAANVIYKPKTTSYFHKNIHIGDDPLPLVWSQYGVIYRKNGENLSIYDDSGLPNIGTLRGCPVYRIKNNGTNITVESVGSAGIYPSNGYLTEDGALVGEYDGSKVFLNNRYEYSREIFIIEEEFLN